MSAYGYNSNLPSTSMNNNNNNRNGNQTYTIGNSNRSENSKTQYVRSSFEEQRVVRQGYKRLCVEKNKVEETIQHSNTRTFWPHTSGDDLLQEW